MFFYIFFKLSLVKFKTLHLSQTYKIYEKHTQLFHIPKTLTDNLLAENNIKTFVYPLQMEPGTNFILLHLRVPSSSIKVGNNLGEDPTVLGTPKQKMTIHICPVSNVVEPIQSQGQ